ncbi:AAA family ATPase [Sphingobacterium corticibacterium]|uniref:ATPase dynein-related AAA domain-containing protein n=1 Tax=Sphingobacterium corticibacterium TaxID=2484746 RepID=A0A4Q6XVQ3_9SPHI|nr:AAA family ATPase [Sphingobacterium corticibacterium]RZF61464.1 hypothetical protein EWE74_01070 [Sphingobacterium corticibacterium]
MTTEDQAKILLNNLKDYKNVLLLGPPASGKSMLMAEVGKAFMGKLDVTPEIKPSDAVPIPAVTSAKIPEWMPSSNRTDRRIFHITFHQGTKHRDFVSGIIPNLQKGDFGFRTVRGVLLEANNHALNGGASLILIDEMNRGPAVSIFGDTLTAIEADKRLDENDKQLYSSAPFKTFDEATGEPTDVFLSAHVYILSSMNEADSSVEALDIAFLRRFKSVRLSPSEQLIKDHFNIIENSDLPKVPENIDHIVSGVFYAWTFVNERISIGKGDAFKIGHGVILGKNKPSNLEDAKQWAIDCWSTIDSLTKELFYGNDEALAVVYNAKAGNHYKMEEFEFGNERIEKLLEPIINKENIFKILREVAGY